MTQRDLFIERVGGEPHLQIARVEFRQHPDDLHHRWIARRREIGILAIAEDECHVAFALPRGGQRIAIPRGVGIRHHGERFGSHVEGLGGIAGDDVGALAGGIFDKGLHAGLQAGDRLRPLHLDRSWLIDCESDQRGLILITQHIEVEVVLPGDLIEELALQHQTPCGAGQRVKVEPRLQMRRQALEIRLPLIHRGADARRQTSGQPRCDQGHGLLTRGIMKRDAGLRRAGLRGDRLLIPDLRALLIAHVRQAKLRQGQRFGQTHRRHVLGPDGRVVHRQRGAIDTVFSGFERAQIGQGGADRRLRAFVGHIKIIVLRVVPLHAETAATAVRMRAAIDPLVALTILEGEAGVVGNRRVVWDARNRSIGRGIRRACHLGVGNHTVALRQWQQRQRHGSLNLRTSRPRVVKEEGSPFA